jgi:vitamin B12 transporter
MFLHCSLFATQNSVKKDSLVISPNTQKLEEVIITDSKFPIKRSQSGKLIKKINREEIAGFQGYDLSD